MERKHPGGYQIYEVPLALVSDQPIAAAQIRDWLEQVCSALHEIHSLKVLHRDLAPKNILCTTAMSNRTSPFTYSPTHGKPKPRRKPLCVCAG